MQLEFPIPSLGAVGSLPHMLHIMALGGGVGYSTGVVYNKIFTKILDSSIWLEPQSTRIVWLTLIASMDEDGFCSYACADNLSRRANAPLSETEAAIKCLESPDPNSSDPDNDGRRIERVPGGWMVLNSGKYRELVTRSISKEKTRARVQKHRENKGKIPHVTLCNAVKRSVTQSEAVSETEAETKTKRGGASLPPLALELFDLWNSTNPLPRCLVISDKRRIVLKARFDDPFFKEHWKIALSKLPKTPFCIGQNPRGWKASFDWFISPDVVTKIMEGKYESDSKPTITATGRVLSDSERAASIVD